MAKKRKVKKRETEGLIMAAQDQALRTNSIKYRIDKQTISAACRMYEGREESISHIWWNVRCLLRTNTGFGDTIRWHK